jgi:hypothetical protein
MYRPAWLHWPGGMDSLAWIPGLLKFLQIQTLVIVILYSIYVFISEPHLWSWAGHYYSTVFIDCHDRPLFLHQEHIFGQQYVRAFYWLFTSVEIFTVQILRQQQGAAFYWHAQWDCIYKSAAHTLTTTGCPFPLDKKVFTFLYYSCQSHVIIPIRKLCLPWPFDITAPSNYNIVVLLTYKHYLYLLVILEDIWHRCHLVKMKNILKIILIIYFSMRVTPKTRLSSLLTSFN